MSWSGERSRQWVAPLSDGRDGSGGEVKGDGVTQLVGWVGRATSGPPGSAGAGDVADLPPVRELFLSDG